MPMVDDPRLGLALVQAGGEEESEGAPFNIQAYTKSDYKSSSINNFQAMLLTGPAEQKHPSARLNYFGECVG